MEFTESFVRSLKPRERRYSEWCTAGDPQGLGLRVQPSGIKSYVLQTQVRPGGRQVLVTLGRAGTMKLPAARKAAWAAIAEIQAGKDPNAEKRALGANTFRALALTYIADELSAMRQGTTVENYLRADWLGEVPFRARVTEKGKTEWRTEWKPGRDSILSNKPASLIAREDILDRLNRIRRARGRFAARHAMDAIRRVMNWAAEQHLAGVRVSPAAGLRDKSVGLTGQMLRVSLRLGTEHQRH